VAKKSKHSGFSLTEVLMAVGILSVGMMFIATMFPVGIYLTGVAAERTMAAIVADEAFAKIQLYGIDLSDPDLDKPTVNTWLDYEAIAGIAGHGIDPNEFSYPSVDPAATGNRQYYWSARCKRLNPSDTEYLVTVFIARKTSPNLTYKDGGDDGRRPKTILIQVEPGTEADELRLPPWVEEKNVNPPTTILDKDSARLYRVVDRKVDVVSGKSNVIKLDRNWDANTNPPSNITLIPPPDTGGKNADVEVYQRIIRF
jgi:prepilin-type N-terminal cleavage/methylation domain-containing protein